MLTLTSRNAVSYTEVESEVSIQQWRTILVDNVSGCDAPEMTQPSLHVREDTERKGKNSEDTMTTDIRADVFSFI